MADERKSSLDRAVRAHQTGSLSEAISIYRELLSKRADPTIQGLLGVALVQQERLQDGLRHLQKAYVADPGNGQNLVNYGHALCLAKRFGDAEVVYSKAVRRDPANEDLFARLFALCDRNGRFGRVIEAARMRLDRNPSDIVAHTALGSAYLASGDYERGWPEFEWRWRAEDFVRKRERLFNRPLWDGRQPLGKRSLLIHAEMGIGDTIQMIRFIPWLSRRYPEARLILFVDPNLEELLADTFASFPTVRVRSIQADRFRLGYDLHLPLMSLARIYGATPTDLENRCPYISADQPLTYGASLELIVGLAWQTKAREDGARRSIPLESFLPICSVPGIRLVDLQYGDTSRERQAFAQKGGEILHDGNVDQLASIKAFARQIAGCDRVVTIDNSTVHIAGALAKPTLLLLPRAANWRWLKDRDDSPWYPSVRLYRQDESGTWPAVIERVAAHLRKVSESKFA